MDNSFIQLNDTFDKANSLGYLKTANLIYQNAIQLSPNETYLQITNVDGGLSFQGNYTVEIINGKQTVLKDITNNVFIEEFVDYNGVTQSVIEIINIGQDFYGQAVYLKFASTVSDDVYWSNPIKITNKNIEETIRIDYSNFETINGVDYDNAYYTQSIRLRFRFTNHINNSENTEYFQISNNRVISTRYLEKVGNAYICDNLDNFTYVRLLRVFKSSTVYLDSQRVTNKPILSEGGVKGYSNLVSATFEAYLDPSDLFVFSYQIFEGFDLTSLYPIDNGYYTLSNIDANLFAVFNTPIDINTGTLTIYDASDDSVVASYTQADMSALGDNGFDIAGILGTGNDIGANGEYYVQFSDGLVSSVLNINYPGISDKTSWNFSIIDGQYNNLQYNNSQYLTN